MKQKQRILPCGRVIYFTETTPHDVGKRITMRKRLLANKKLLDALYPFDNAGRTNLRWSGMVYNRFTTFLVESLVDNLLQGNRIETFDGHMWLIGNRKDAGKYVNWHTNGHAFSVVIRGLKGNFGIRLSRKNRKALRDRINAGQKYHVDD